MQFLRSLIGRTDTLTPPKVSKLTKVQKHQAKELADAKMALAQAESAEEYYRHHAEMFRARIERIEGSEMFIGVGGSA